MAGGYIGGQIAPGGYFDAHQPGCMCGYCKLSNPGQRFYDSYLNELLTMQRAGIHDGPVTRLGWICSRCGRSLSPDVTVCACKTCGE